MSRVTLTGPNQHPLLGTMLGVDFSPKKVCSFDCVYCEDATTRKTMEREPFCAPDEVVEAVRRHVDEHGVPQTLLLTGGGEPTLYAGFGEMVRALRAAFPDVACTLYTNGSLLFDPAVREEVATCDPVMGNLNSADAATFVRIARQHRAASAESTIAGYRALRRELTTQRLWMDGIFLKGVNDGADGLVALGRALCDIGPDLYTVRTTRRVIAVLCEPVDASFQSVVEKAWARFNLPVQFALPAAPAASSSPR